ncbi:hypothetical protein MKW92_039265 [Papaver armeniacum]|nr:hypothetical protein MKW92_039265 [Papaver armeniacum]
MVLNGAAPPRRSAATPADHRRRRTTSGGGGSGNSVLQFYTDDPPGLKISPNVLLVMSIGSFIAFVAVSHVIGKLYLCLWVKIISADFGKFGR